MTEQIKYALEDCPFCGSAAEMKTEIVYEHIREKNMPMFTVRCSECLAAIDTDGWFSKKQAVARWNTRPQPQTVGDDVQACWNFLEQCGGDVSETNDDGCVFIEQTTHYNHCLIVLRTALQAAKPESVDVEALKREAIEAFCVPERYTDRDSRVLRIGILGAFDHLTANGYRIVKEGGG